MLAYVAESAASAPPPRQGPPLIPPPRASSVAGGTARGGDQSGAVAAGELSEAEEAIAAFGSDAGLESGDGPSLEDLEAQMGGEVAARDAASGRKPERMRAAGAEDDDDAPGGGKGAPLPELDSLVARLPTEVRETVEELLRVRFVTVKKVPKQALSGDAPPAAGAA